ISWAIRDNVQNALSGFMVFFSPSYDIGDEIMSETGHFHGVITAFNLQYVSLRRKDGIICYVPNGKLWTEVINITRGDIMNGGIAMKPSMARYNRYMPT